MAVLSLTRSRFTKIHHDSPEKSAPYEAVMFMFYDEHSMSMKPTPYLQDRAYYEDCYDRNTVEICREEKKSWFSNLPPSTAADPRIREVINKIWPDLLWNVVSWYVAGDRYTEREETIREWMAADRRRDDQLEKAVSPMDILCRACDTPMHEETKNLYGSSVSKEEKVLFIFRCPKCKSGRGIYEDGTEWQRPYPGNCKKCNVILTRSYEGKDEHAVTISRCRRCGYEEREEIDLGPTKKPSAAEEHQFLLDRERYCFSEEKGQQYVKRAPPSRMKVDEQTVEERRLREAAKQLKKTSIVSIEKILKAALPKEGYVRLRFQPPEMERDVIVKFTVHDERTERQEHTSRYSLQHCIEAALSETNWRLMSDGVHYRLGVLQGRLRGYEREEDLMKLIQVREKKNV